MGCVYRATCNTNGKQYIGMTTKTLERRRYEHTVSDDGTIFHKAIKKYTRDDFEWEVLYESDDEDALFKKERLYIKLFGALYPLGYNMASGGRGSPDMYLSSKAKRRLRANGMKKAKDIYCVELDRVFHTFVDIRRELHISRDTVVASMKDIKRSVKKYHFCIATQNEMNELKEWHESGNLKYGIPFDMNNQLKAAASHRGVPMSEEQKEKIRATMIGIKRAPRTAIEIENIKRGIVAGRERRLKESSANVGDFSIMKA